MIAISTNVKMLSPIMRSLVVQGQRTCMRPIASLAACSNSMYGSSSVLQSQIQPVRQLGSGAKVFSNDQSVDGRPQSLATILEREIQEETAELNQRLSSDQFPGFSVETDDADVKLTKQVGDTTVIVRFTVSSSLTEWKTDTSEQGQIQGQQQDIDHAYSLVSLPEFQVQISKDSHTLEVSCYFDELEHDEETGEPYPMDPMFSIDELVMYKGEPKESEFAVSAEYFRDDLQESMQQYLADHGIDEGFAKNLVSFSTSYEKKQYIALMRRLKDFVSK